MKKTVLVLFLITIGISISGCTTKKSNAIDDNSVDPDEYVHIGNWGNWVSLDKYYQNNSSEYLDKMYKLEETMQIIVNINQSQIKTSSMIKR